MKKIKKLISIVLVVTICIGAYNTYSEMNSFLKTDGSDEERITDTIEKFQESYNNGNFEDLLKCCSDRYSSTLESQMGLGSSFFSSVISAVTSKLFDVGDGALGYLWSLGTQYCAMTLDIQEITFLSDTTAEVRLIYSDATSTKETQAYLEMEKQGEAWYVAGDFYEYSQQ